MVEKSIGWKRLYYLIISFYFENIVLISLNFLLFALNLLFFLCCVFTKKKRKQSRYLFHYIITYIVHSSQYNCNKILSSLGVWLQPITRHLSCPAVIRCHISLVLCARISQIKCKTMILKMSKFNAEFANNCVIIIIILLINISVIDIWQSWIRLF